VRTACDRSLHWKLAAAKRRTALPVRATLEPTPRAGRKSGSRRVQTNPRRARAPQQNRVAHELCSPVAGDRWTRRRWDDGRGSTGSRQLGHVRDRRISGRFRRPTSIPMLRWSGSATVASFAQPIPPRPAAELVSDAVFRGARARRGFGRARAGTGLAAPRAGGFERGAAGSAVRASRLARFSNAGLRSHAVSRRGLSQRGDCPGSRRLPPTGPAVRPSGMIIAPASTAASRVASINSAAGRPVGYESRDDLLLLVCPDGGRYTAADTEGSLRTGPRRLGRNCASWKRASRDGGRSHRALAGRRHHDGVPHPRVSPERSVVSAVGLCGCGCHHSAGPRCDRGGPSTVRRSDGSC